MIQPEDALRELDIELPRSVHSILLVDDEPENLDVFSALLTSIAPVLTAQSGDEALRIISEHDDIGLIIADQRMPGMSGVELLTHVASQYPQIVRIVLTGYSDVEPMLQAINRAKTWRFLVKPCVPEQLRASAREALRMKDRTELLERLSHVLSQRRDSLSQAVRDLRNAQDDLLALERLATVGPAVAGIVHNLRNLSTLMSFVMAEISRHEVAPGIKDVVQSAGDSMESLVELLENVHRLAQPSEAELKLELINVERFMGTTAAMGMIHTGGHPIVASTNSNPPVARVDAERLRQGLLALVDNAVRASEEQRPVRLTATTVPPPIASERASCQSGEWLCIEVSDQGSGMDSDTLLHAAEPFYSGFSPPRLGLGLEFARLAARAHGGCVEIESEPGRGTVARLLVPLNITDEELESSASSRS